MAFKLLSFILLLTISFSFEIQRQILEIDPVSAIPWPFTSCGDGDWTIEKVTLGQTPKKNSNNNIVITGTANAAIEFKGVNLSVKVNGVVLDKEFLPDCKGSYDEGDAVQCKYTRFIPSFSPSGNYSLKFDFQDSNDKSNGCIEFQFKL